MRTFVLIFKLLLVFELHAQLSWFEAFQNQNSTFILNWQGDTADFYVADSLLHLDAPGAGKYGVFRPSSIGIQAAWRGGVRMEFNPSTSNYTEIGLMLSDTNSIKQGYGIKFGGTADDLVSLIRYDGTSSQVLISTSSGYLNHALNEVYFEVIRTDSLWFMRLNDTLIGTVHDNTYLNSSFFSLNAEVTATRKDKVHFSAINVQGSEYMDVTPPSVISITPVNLNRFEVVFDEPLNNPKEGKIFLLLPTPHDGVLEWQSDVQFEFSIQQDLSNLPKLRMRFVGFADEAQNELDTTLDIINPFYFAESIVISEIMYDPTPSFGLPENEYLEIVNVGDVEIKLNDWKTTINGVKYSFPDTIMSKGAIWILSADGSLNSLRMMWSTAALPNSGGEVSIVDQWNRIREQVSYSPNWHTSNTAMQGGVSLELLDMDNRCVGKWAWASSSLLTGGSPGSVNFKFCDIPALRLVQMEWEEETWILTFNQQLDSIRIKPIEEKTRLKSISHTGNMVRISTEFLQELGSLKINAYSCLDHLDSLIAVGNPQLPFQGDLRITEVLFNPFPNERRYIELRNVSGKFIALKELKFVSIVDEDADSSSLLQTRAVIAPGEVLFLSDSPELVMHRYPFHGRGVQVELPKMDDKHNELILLNSQGSEIERIILDESFHHIAFTDVEGRALALKTMVFEGTNEHAWESTSDEFFGGTPGIWEPQAGSDEFNSITWRNGRFSPNGDGINDQLIVVNQKSGRTGLLQIFETTGQLIWEQDLGLMEMGAQYHWDGRDDHGQLVIPGYYFCILTTIDDAGQKEKNRNVILVTQD